MKKSSSAFLSAIFKKWGSSEWTPGEFRDNTRTAAAAAIGKSASKVLAGDFNALIYDLWEEGVLELVPAKKGQKTNRIRLTEKAESCITASTETIETAYKQLSKESKLRHVFFSDIRDKSGATSASIHEWALSLARKGKAELGKGDWSLATKAQRQSSFKKSGKLYLTVGLTNS